MYNDFGVNFKNALTFPRAFSWKGNKPIPSCSKCEIINMTDDILYSHANKTQFHKKDFALNLISKVIVLRPIHTRDFAPGACSRLILHVSVHTRERFQVRSICPGSLLPNI